MSHSARWRQRGTRPVRVANCSGAAMDPGYQMLRQATQGDVDFITGDYLAELNIAVNAEAFANGTHEGFEPTAWDGIKQSIEAIAEKHIKLIINGGAINPAGLAEKTLALAKDKELDLKVAYVSGDNLMREMQVMLRTTGSLPEHLDSEDAGIQLAKNARAYLEKDKPIVAANAYLGARAIVKGLETGADIIICGRVADASPVIGAAWYWHSWADSDYDRLAGALVAGHLIECSAYVTGANFSGFTDYDLDSLVDIAFGIAEIESDGTCVITKHQGTKGIVNEDTVICQFLYELQGDIYLNSDVKAYISSIAVEQIGKDRVLVTGIKGAPPPPTTKLGVFYRGGYQCQLLVCATGYGTSSKFTLEEKQIRHGLTQKGLLSAFDVLEFQRVGIPAPNASTQLRSTTYLRIFAQAASSTTVSALQQTFLEYGMQHFSGWGGSLDWPHRDHHLPRRPKHHHPAGHPPTYEPLERRPTYDTTSPPSLSSFGPTRRLRLGDICLARSGDKGANINFGIYPRHTTLLPTTDPLRQQSWDWLRTLMTRDRLRLLIGDDWRDEYHIERVEFPNIMAVHFVVYGILGRGVGGAASLDPLGKGFADWIRDRVVEVPVVLVEALVGRVSGLEAGEVGALS